nr:secoisolariciresinol dehydrogenase-like [Ipomoea batatas]
MASSSLLSTTAKRLEGKVAIITGGVGGIGSRIAQLFCEHGAKVLIADTRDDESQSICNSLFVQCDVTSESDVQNAVNKAVSTHGRLDIMVNNAGIAGAKVLDILDCDATDFVNVFRVNTLGAFLGTKHAARVMKPVQRGSIINTASVAGVDLMPEDVAEAVLYLASDESKVRDKTSDAPFLLWDNECTQLIGMTAGTLKNKYPKDSVEIPSEVESLHSKAMVFKVSVKNDQLSNPGRPIPVLKIVDDDDLVSTYCTSWTNDQDQLSKKSDEEEGDLESEGSELGDEASSPALDQTGKTISDETDDRMEPRSTKRCLLDQFSSSQDFKRSKYVIIKQEKK